MQLSLLLLFAILLSNGVCISIATETYSNPVNFSPSSTTSPPLPPSSTTSRPPATTRRAMNHHRYRASLVDDAEDVVVEVVESPPRHPHHHHYQRRSVVVDNGEKEKENNENSNNNDILEYWTANNSTRMQSAQVRYPLHSSRPPSPSPPPHPGGRYNNSIFGGKRGDVLVSLCVFVVRNVHIHVRQVIIFVVYYL